MTNEQAEKIYTEMMVAIDLELEKPGDPDERKEAAIKAAIEIFTKHFFKAMVIDPIIDHFKSIDFTKSHVAQISEATFMGKPFIGGVIEAIDKSEKPRPTIPGVIKHEDSK